LGDALSARRSGQREVATTTADGTLHVRLVALADAQLIEIHTPTGIFRGPDHVIEIADLNPYPNGASAVTLGSSRGAGAERQASPPAVLA
jgi:hypothetical protein